jgi:hypothetical protein
VHASNNLEPSNRGKTRPKSQISYQKTAYLPPFPELKVPGWSICPSISLNFNLQKCICIHHPKYPCNSAPPTNSGSPVSLGSRDAHRACRKQPDASRKSLPACRSRLPRGIATCNRQSTFPTWIPEHLTISVPAQRIVPCPACSPPRRDALHVSAGGRGRANPLWCPGDPHVHVLVSSWYLEISYWTGAQSSMNWRKKLKLFSAGPFSRPVATWDTDIKSQGNCNEKEKNESKTRKFAPNGYVPRSPAIHPWNEKVLTQPTCPITPNHSSYLRNLEFDLVLAMLEVSLGHAIGKLVLV